MSKTQEEKNDSDKERQESDENSSQSENAAEAESEVGAEREGEDQEATESKPDNTENRNPNEEDETEEKGESGEESQGNPEKQTDTIVIDEREFQIVFPDAAPPLKEETQEALRASIEEDGIKTPILVDENDRVIDGHHRLEIAADLDLSLDEVPIETTEDDSDEPFRIAVALNGQRRSAQGDPSRRRQWVAQLTEAWERRYDKTPSNREISNLLGVSHTTINRDIEKLKANGNERLEAMQEVKKICQRHVTRINKIGDIIDEIRSGSFELDESFSVSLACSEEELDTAANVLARIQREFEEARDEAKESMNSSEREQNETSELNIPDDELYSSLHGIQ